MAQRKKMTRKIPKAKHRKKFDVGASILKSLDEAVQWAKGEEVPGVRVRHVKVPSPLDVKAIRKRMGMSQSEFAHRFGFSPSTLRNWEQGIRRPETTARVLLTIIDHAPDVVEEALRP